MNLSNHKTEQLLVSVFSAKSLVPSNQKSHKESSKRTVNQGQILCCLESKACDINIYDITVDDSKY
jgi:hypothetical protein